VYTSISLYQLVYMASFTNRRVVGATSNSTSLSAGEPRSPYVPRTSPRSPYVCIPPCAFSVASVICASYNDFALVFRFEPSISSSRRERGGSSVLWYKVHAWSAHRLLLFLLLLLLLLLLLRQGSGRAWGRNRSAGRADVERSCGDSCCG
jgi:hypothetical protein